MSKQDRYKQIEKFMTVLLAATLVFFIVFLIASGCGVIWLKVVTCIVTVLPCGLSLAVLYLTKLLWKPRSLWMTCAACAILICLLVSMICNFPSPV